MDVPGVLAQVAGIDLPYPAAELLQSFIENALNLPSQPMQAFSDGDALPELDAETHEAIWQRDGGTCCITGKKGTFWDPLVVHPVVCKPSQWLEAKSSLNEILSAFLTPPYRHWWLSRLGDYQFMQPLSSHWLVRRSAANAFAAGALRLNRLQPSEIEYEIRPNLIGPEKPLDVRGFVALLGDRSRRRLTPVDMRLIGTHSRLSESLRFLELARDIAPGLSPNLNRSVTRFMPTRPLESFPIVRPGLSLFRNFFHCALIPIWRLFPARIRKTAYDILRYAGERLYGPSVPCVQRLPLGLYLKYHVEYSEARNEFSALQAVAKHTSIPVPRPLDIVRCRLDETDENDSNSYLLMSRVSGEQLARCQTFMSDSDLDGIASELTTCISELRGIPRLATSTPTTICNTLGEACRDPRVQGEMPVGPFADEAAFSQVIRFSDEPSRRGHSVLFTHGDLNPRNILVGPVRRPDGSLRWGVTGIVDWMGAGYFPEYWDYTKALYERFRWPKRYNDLVKRAFAPFGDYSRELDVEIRSWESGDGL